MVRVGGFSSDAVPSVQAEFIIDDFDGWELGDMLGHLDNPLRAFWSADVQLLYHTEMQLVKMVSLVQQ